MTCFLRILKDFQKFFKKEFWYIFSYSNCSFYIFDRQTYFLVCVWLFFSEFVSLTLASPLFHSSLSPFLIRRGNFHSYQNSCLKSALESLKKFLSLSFFSINFALSIFTLNTFLFVTHSRWSARSQSVSRVQKGCIHQIWINIISHWTLLKKSKIIVLTFSEIRIRIFLLIKINQSIRGLVPGEERWCWSAGAGWYGFSPTIPEPSAS